MIENDKRDFLKKVGCINMTLLGMTYLQIHLSHYSQ